MRSIDRSIERRDRAGRDRAGRDRSEATGGRDWPVRIGGRVRLWVKVAARKCTVSRRKKRGLHCQVPQLVSGMYRMPRLGVHNPDF